MKPFVTLMLLALFAVQMGALVSPAQAEAPTIDERVEHLEATMDGLLYQLENCIPRPAKWKTVRTKRGRSTLYVVVLTDKQRRVCFNGHS